MSRMIKRHRKMEVLMVPACPVLAMAFCSAPLQQQTRQLLQGPTATPCMVGREQLAQGEAFSSRDNLLAGREPLAAAQATALESLTNTATSAPSPTELDTLATLWCVIRCPSWVRTSLLTEGATALLQVLGNRG